VDKPVLDPDKEVAVLMRLRMAAEQREAQAHNAAAALDECLTLLMLALRQAAATRGGMQQRRAKRLISKFTILRMDALDGKSPCHARKVLETMDEALDNTDRLVR
jgi:hypothetical protein